jgi:hypothetical protein
LSVSVVNLEMPDRWLSDITEAVRLRIEEQDRWVTVDGLCEWLGCETGHVYDLRDRGLPARRIPDEKGRLSKKLYFSLREVSDWFEAVGRAV